MANHTAGRGASKAISRLLYLFFPWLKRAFPRTHEGSPVQAGGYVQWRIQACMAIPAATPALMERVEPNWEMDST